MKSFFKHLDKLNEWGEKYSIDPEIVEERKASAIRRHRRTSNFMATVHCAARFIEVDFPIEDIRPQWFETYQNCAETVSDREVQALWGKILAGEVNEPGRFSLRTLTTLHTMEKSDIGAISELAATTSFVEKAGRQVPYSIELKKNEFGTDITQEARKNEVVSKESRFKLIDLGLVHELSWGSFTVSPQESIRIIVGSECMLALNPTNEPITCVPCRYRLTKVGIDLLSLCETFGTRTDLAEKVSDVLVSWGFEITRDAQLD